MEVTSLEFLVFVLAAVALYYLMPDTRKPYMLIALSFLFIASYDLRGILFLLGTALLIWYSGRKLKALDTSSREPAAVKTEKRRILMLTLVLVIGILAVLKYLGPMALGLVNPGGAGRLFVPIGLSYFTLQAVSYVMDVYWKRIPSEQHYSRVLLFLCYFPQILQGPISRYRELSYELYEKPHGFQWHNVKYGVQRMLWGYFKVLVVANKLHHWVNNAFYGAEEAYGWVALWGLIAAGFELYANFSGGIDIILGISRCLGIELAENFRQPFFSRSLGEFWRRWHITLGSWMKDYVFFPLSLSRPFSRLKKSLKKRLDRKMANRIPIALADIAVFLLVGIWHGLGSNYALWGLYNGLILAFSEVMAARYLKAKQALSIRDDSRLWTAFCILRTFVIITIGWATDCTDTAMGSFRIVGNLIRFAEANPEIMHTTFFGFLTGAAGVAVMLGVDLLHEMGHSLRDWLNKRNFLVQAIFWILVIQIIAMLGRDASVGGLMYAGF